MEVNRLTPEKLKQIFQIYHNTPNVGPISYFVYLVNVLQPFLEHKGKWDYDKDGQPVPEENSSD